MLDVVYPLIMDELKQRFEKTKQLQGLTAQYLLEFGKNASLTREQQEQYNESQSKLEKQRENVTRHSVIKDQLAKELASLSVKSLETKYYFIDKASVFKEVKGITDTIHIEGYLIDEDFKVVPFSSVFKSHWIKDMYGNKEN